MITIPQSRLPDVTTAELVVRVDAYKSALAAHALTIGVPGPLEDSLVMALANTDDTFEIVPDEAMLPEGPPAPELTFTEKRSRAVMFVNQAAEEARLRYITPGAGQAATYLIKERQAEEFKAAAYAGTAPGMVAAEVAATGMTAQQAADFILAQRDFWVNKAADIERVRRIGSVTIDGVLEGDDAALEAAANYAVTSLRSL
jgi:hypothetical protein